MSEQPDLRLAIRQEYIKCASDPVHFMKKYCYISHPQRGRINFQLYPFQERVLNLWKNNRYCINNKSRQLGISTLAAGYSLWMMLFYKDKNILCIATKQETAKNMVTKVKFMYENLPSWLREKDKPVEDNKLTLKFNNGSQIKAVSAAGDAGRSEAVSMLLVDEAAFIENIDEIWASAQQTLATGGQAIIISTPYGTGNWFHKTWVKAEAQENDFIPIKLPWTVHPERDENWRKQQDELLGDPRLAAQECDASFATSGETVVHPEVIDFYDKTYIKEPLERRGIDQNLWIWEPANYTKQYMVVADVARGDGKDFSAFHVIDIESNTQAAEYKGQIGTKEFGHLLVGIATEYNRALLVVENSNIGWSTIQTILELNYSNFYHSPKSGDSTSDTYFTPYMDTSRMTPGFTINLKNRPIVVGKFLEYLGDKSLVVHSKRLMGEVKVFVWRNGKAEAQSGYNDDLVMSMAIGMFMRDTAFKLRQQGIDITKSLLNNTGVKSYGAGAYFSTGTDNPYHMKLDNGSDENISWLIR